MIFKCKTYFPKGRYFWKNSLITLILPEFLVEKKNQIPITKYTIQDKSPT